MEPIEETLRRSALTVERLHGEKVRSQIAWDLQAAHDRLIAASKRADAEEYTGLRHLIQTALLATEDAKDAVL